MPPRRAAALVEPAVLSQQLMAQLENSEPVTVAKANIKSRVHRRIYMDYIGVKRYGADGRPSGEIRFVGLFTSEAYDRPAFEVPLIRRKAERVLKAAETLGLSTSGYNEKRLKNILETYPRDELFQMTEQDLLRIARGILHLADRPRVKLFTRDDPFDRFISVLLYSPREIYQSKMQKGRRTNPGQRLWRQGQRALSLYQRVAAVVHPLHYRRGTRRSSVAPDIGDRRSRYRSHDAVVAAKDRRSGARP